MGQQLENFRSRSRTRPRRGGRAAATALVIAVTLAGWAGISVGAAGTAAAAAASSLKAVASPNGPATTLTFATGGETGVISFSGLVGEHVTVATSAGTFASSCALHLHVVAPNGKAASTAVCAGTSATVGPISLGADGTYTLKLVAAATATGAITVAITSSGTISSITPDAPSVLISITQPHQSVLLGFFAHAGERFSAVTDNGNVTPTCRIGLTITGADGEAIGGTTCVGAPSTGFVDAGTIPTDGVYHLQAFEHDGSATPASFHAKVFSVVDVTGPITANGKAVPLDVTTPGQNAEYSFAGSTGQRLSVLVSNYTIDGGCFIYLFRPDGSQLTYSQCDVGYGGFLDTTNLDTTGTWTLEIDPDAAGPWVGTATVQAFTVADLTAAIAPGQKQKVTFTVPGQNAALTFSGTAGDHRTITVTDVSIPTAFPTYFTTAIVRPDGTLFDGVEGAAPGATLNETLDETGTWTIRLDPGFAETGIVRVALK